MELDPIPSSGFPCVVEEPTIVGVALVHVEGTVVVEIGDRQTTAVGTVVGKALEPLEAGTGLIRVLVMQR